MGDVARFIDDAIDAGKRGDEATLDGIAAQVREMMVGFPAPGLEGV